MEFPTLNASMQFRRCKDMEQVERDFHERILAAHEEGKADELESFKKKANVFLNEVTEKAIPDLVGTTNRYISTKVLTEILKKSPDAIKTAFTMETVLALVKITRYNFMINIDFIESLIKSFIHVDTIYIKLLPYAENTKEIMLYQLQEFITDNYAPLMKEQPERVEYYSAYVASVMFFLLDSRLRDCVSIHDLLVSNLINHLECCILFENQETDTQPALDVFCLAVFRRTLEEFRRLDQDRNGLLSKSEMMMFRNSYYNTLFIDRIFEISVVYENSSLDFKGFVDLLTAINFRHTKPSIRFHFEAFDLKDDGFLDEAEIRQMCLQLQECIFQDDSIPTPEMMTKEVMDMMKCKERITLKDVLNNELNSIFTGFVTNFPDWLRYERREM